MYFLGIIPLFWLLLFMEFQKSSKHMNDAGRLVFIIFLVISAPFVLLITFHTLCYFVQIPIHAIVYFNIVYFPALLSMALLILGIVFFKKYYQVKLLNIVVLLLLISLLTVPLAQFTATKYIYVAAQKRFQKQPEYVDITFDCEVRRPHAIVLKNDKTYYWSFREDKFIESENIRSWL